MKRLKIPKKNSLRVLINVVLIVAYFFISDAITTELMFSGRDRVLVNLIGYQGYLLLQLILFISFIFFITRYIWFEKSRNRTFYGLFNKLKFPNLEARIYTNTSNADELKKYSELKDQGIITEEEFQAKKKKLLDL